MILAAESHTGLSGSSLNLSFMPVLISWSESASPNMLSKNCVPWKVGGISMVLKSVLPV